MRWPEIFFKSRKTKASSTPEPSKPPSKVPSISELEKSVEPSPTQIAAEKTAAESLRALRQSTRIEPAPRPPSPTSSGTKETSPLPAAASVESSSPLAPIAVRRRAKLTDVARMLLPGNDAVPPKIVPQPSPGVSDAPSERPAAVVPAAFPVAGTAGTGKTDPSTETVPSYDRSTDVPPEAVEKKDSDAPPIDLPARVADPAPDPGAPATEAATASLLKETTRVSLPESAVSPPKIRPPTAAIEAVKPPSDVREKREFVLANGERILGHILSETAETIYLDHQTLGVLTLPRAQIANKPIEVILINGDRVVGDLIAETTECLYIRHASLGMLTVPHGQRSTRVVEAILKDGDRILGEVLAETDHFTVIRSATLGTVAVQHEQVAMLNRKIEQMQLRALPASSLEDAKPTPPSP